MLVDKINIIAAKRIFLCSFISLLQIQTPNGPTSAGARRSLVFIRDLVRALRCMWLLGPLSLLKPSQVSLAPLLPSLLQQSAIIYYQTNLTPRSAAVWLG